MEEKRIKKSRRRAHNGVLRDRRAPGVTTENVKALLDSIVESSFLEFVPGSDATGEYPIYNLNSEKDTCASSDCICLSLPKAACCDQSRALLNIHQLIYIVQSFQRKASKAEKTGK